MQTPDLVYALGLPPRDAVAYLESKGITPTRHWYDIWQEAQAKAVTVSGMTRLDLLEDVKKGLVDAVKNGKTGKMFIDDLAPLLRAKGWTGKRQNINPKTGEVTEKGPDLPARLSLIFFQNVQSAYMYGRYRAMLANAEERPWWMYIAVLDSRTRPHHRALHRKVFRYDDPFWKTHYPPNGFYCRCRVRALSDAQLEREGLIPESGEGRMVSREVVVNPRAPENQQIVREVWGWQERPGGLTHWTDTGFSYSAGYTTYQLDCELAQKLELIKSDALYAEVVQAINNAPARHAAFGLWIEEKLASKWKTGDAVVVGLVQPEVVAAAKAAGLDPARIAVMTDKKAVHVDRGIHQEVGKALSLEQYKALAKNFADPEAVYWDVSHNNALYVFPDPDPEWCVIMPLSMPSGDTRAMKKIGKYDGVATAYREKRWEIKRRGMAEIKLSRKDRN